PLAQETGEDARVCRRILDTDRGQRVCSSEAHGGPSVPGDGRRPWRTRRRGQLRRPLSCRLRDRSAGAVQSRARPPCRPALPRMTELVPPTGIIDRIIASDAAHTAGRIEVIARDAGNPLGATILMEGPIHAFGVPGLPTHWLNRAVGFREANAGE